MKIACFCALLSVFFLVSLPASAEVLFRDQFQNGKSSRWSQKNDGSRSGKFRAQSGAYFVISDDPAVSLPRSLVQDSTNQNYYIQADVAVTPISRSYAAASLIAYYIDRNHYYEFAIDTANRYWSLRKQDKLGQTLLAQGEIVQNIIRHRVGLYCLNGELRAFIGGNMVAQVSDSNPLPGGAFGISARGAETRWDNVVVKNSNPDEFHYDISSATSNRAGRASFGSLAFVIKATNGVPAAGIHAFRIDRDGLSYFIFHDPKAKLLPRSGFVSEFAAIKPNEYAVILRNSGTGYQRDTDQYSATQRNWLFSFLRRSARIETKAVSANLKILRNLHLRHDALENDDGLAIDDSVLGKADAQTEVNAFLFGEWDEVGNYQTFPVIAGRISNSQTALNSAIEILKVPQNSIFTLFTLNLSAGSSTVPISWFVQEDSRPVLVTEAADIPRQLRAGSTYTIPFTIFNSGEAAAGRFFVSFFLSPDANLGTRDKRLIRRSFESIGAGARLTSEMQITIPSDTPAGHYFLGAVIETENRRERIVRINNTAATRPVTVGDFPAHGQLDATLAWEGAADLDLHLSDPFGEKVYYFHPVSKSGGRLMKDANCISSGDKTEQITYESGNAAAGSYIISIHHFSSCGSPREVRWTLTVRADGRLETFNGVIKPGEYLKAAESRR